MRPPRERVEPAGGMGRLWHLLGGLDTRSLAAFRVGLAALVLVDLAIRSGDLSTFYTDQGLLTCDQARTLAANTWTWSIHWWSGSAWWIELLFAVQALCALSMLVGYRARLSCALVWALLASLQTRNGQVLQGGDVLVRCMLFWGMLLPIGAKWSLDQARVPLEHPPAPTRVASIPALALQLQVCYLYLFTSALKTGADWLTDHTAVWYALSIDQLATPLGHWLTQMPGLSKMLTAVTMVQERYGVLLLIVPALIGAAISHWRRDGWRAAERLAGWGRMLAVLSFVGFHLGLAACMVLGPFPWICWTAWLAFLPASFWDVLAARWARGREGLEIWYDGGCGFCRLMVACLRTAAALPRHSVRAAQEDPEILALMERENSWVVTTPDGTRHLRLDALSAALRRSPLLFPLGWALRAWPIRPLGDAAYRFIAARRTQASAWVRWLKPRSNPLEFGRWGQLGLDLAAAVLIYYCLLWNWRALYTGEEFNKFARRWFPTNQNWILQIPRLDQWWTMFAPMPLRDDGWYVADARLSDGSRLDLLTGKAVVDSEPARPELVYRNERWRKYLMNLYTDDFASFRARYARWLAERWDAHAPPLLDAWPRSSWSSGARPTPSGARRSWPD